LKGIPFYLESYEYDPNRSSFINLVFYKNGIYAYILSTMNTYLGSSYICSSSIFDTSVYGNRFVFFNIPIGSIVNNVSVDYFSKCKYIRAAGTFGILIKKDSKFAFLKLPSSNKFFFKDIFLKCSLFGFGTLGRMSNMMNKNVNRGKAGKTF
jgi:large subunit ribosomal protein L2